MAPLKIIVLNFAALLLSFNFCFSQVRYWVGGTGSWSQTSHWSTSSGGAGGASVPTASDDVIVNAASGSSFTITFDGSPVCNSLTTTGSNAFTLTGSASVTVAISESMTMSVTNHIFSGTYNFTSTNIGNTISLNNTNNTASAKFLFSGSGAWTFMTNAIISTSIIQASNGSLNTNGNAITTKEYLATGSNTINLDITNSTINLSLYFTGTAGLNLMATNSTINFTGNLSEIRSCTSDVFNKVNFTATSTSTTNNGKIDAACNNCTFSKLFFNHHGNVLG